MLEYTKNKNKAVLNNKSIKGTPPFRCSNWVCCVALHAGYVPYVLFRCVSNPAPHRPNRIVVGGEARERGDSLSQRFPLPPGRSLQVATSPNTAAPQCCSTFIPCMRSKRDYSLHHCFAACCCRVFNPIRCPALPILSPAASPTWRHQGQRRRQPRRQPRQPQQQRRQRRQRQQQMWRPRRCQGRGLCTLMVARTVRF